MVPTPKTLGELAAELKRVSEVLAQGEPSQLSPQRAKTVRKAISQAYTRLGEVIEELDPVKRPGSVFDPSNPNVVGRLVGITLVAQPRKVLTALDKFYGSGVYAIYYNGAFPPYAAITKKEHPIYVGKADPADPASKTAVEQGDRLANRLSDHRKNIVKAESTLHLEDFEYRALVVQTGWQGAAENYLIHLFHPIWNNETKICYGFGKHGDAFKTRANLRSPWDTLHPGRAWAHGASEMKDARPKQQIIADIAAHLEKHPPLSTLDQILRRFIAEIRKG